MSETLTGEKYKGSRVVGPGEVRCRMSVYVEVCGRAIKPYIIVVVWLLLLLFPLSGKFAVCRAAEAETGCEWICIPLQLCPPDNPALHFYYLSFKLKILRLAELKMCFKLF